MVWTNYDKGMVPEGAEELLRAQPVMNLRVLHQFLCRVKRKLDSRTVPGKKPCSPGKLDHETASADGSILESVPIA
jgi:hypothetical protein